MKLLIGKYDREGTLEQAETVTVRWSLAGDKGQFDINRNTSLNDVIDKVRELKAEVDEHPLGFHDGV